MNPTVQGLDRAGPGEVATAIQNPGIAAAGGGSDRPGEPAEPGTPGAGSSVGAARATADQTGHRAGAVLPTCCGTTWALASWTDHVEADSTWYCVDDDRADTTATGPATDAEPGDDWILSVTAAGATKSTSIG